MKSQRQGKLGLVPSLGSRIGSSIRTRRVQLGWSQEELGFAASIHRPYIGEIERGKKAITIAKLKQLADALGCKPSDILSDIDL